MTTFDLPSVRRFAAEVSKRAAECSENDEFCSDLDHHIQCLAAECWAWIDAVKRWASAVYFGRAVFDSDVEALFRSEISRIADKARPHAQHGREVFRECFSLARLDDLENYVAELDFLTANWVSPKPAVLVGGRAEMPAEVAQSLEPRVQELPPLPAGWLPDDPWQRRRFMENR